MVGKGQAMVACRESGRPCDSWWPVVGGTDGWQLVANGWQLEAVAKPMAAVIILQIGGVGGELQHRGVKRDKDGRDKCKDFLKTVYVF